MVGLVIVLSRKIVDPARTGDRPRLDVLGAVLSAAGLFFVVFGILQSSTYGWLAARKAFTVGGVELIPEGGISPVWIFVAAGSLILWWFFRHVRSVERSGGEPLLASRLFRNRTSNLGLTTQIIQWLVLQGSFFVVSVYLQQVWTYNAVQTGLMLTPATVGLLLASAMAGRMAERRAQRTLISGGFAIGIAGSGLILALVRSDSGIFSFIPGLLLVGIGLGVMLTASVNVVQSSFPAPDQGDISGLSRSASNLGSSLGTALVGSVLVAAASPGGRAFGLSLATLMVIALIGLVAALMLPRTMPAGRSAEPPGEAVLSELGLLPPTGGWPRREIGPAVSWLTAP
jgi:predicted MFS family arabinose efflux permease